VRLRANHLLAAWAGVLTVVLAVVALTGASDTRSAQFDVLDVQRINVREADGTLRMVVSSAGRFPGIIVGGREYPLERPGAGLLFYNDEGTEAGGLGTAGRRAVDGEVEQFVHLSMDRYEQDQVVTLTHQEYGDAYAAGLVVNDRGSRSVEEVLATLTDPEASAEQRAAAGALHGEGYAERVFLGRRGPEGRGALVLRDATGAPALQLRVEGDGTAAIEFLNGDGNVTATVSPETISR
jgi:hypothetical protein